MTNDASMPPTHDHPVPDALTTPRPDQTATGAPMPPPKVRWRLVAIFAGCALAVMTLAAAPFWFLERGTHHPAYAWSISCLGMFAPLIASLVTCRVAREKWRASTGLRFEGRWGRIVLWSILGTALTVVLTLAAAVIMILRGVPGDLTGKTWATLVQQQLADAGQELSIPMAVLAMLIGVGINLLVSTISAFGEEVGWRGWLWRELKPLGFTGAIVIGGVIWSLWHLPIVLIGHNYPGMPRPFAIGMFLVFCVALNLLLGAITERSGGNPIPAAFTHSAVNTFAAIGLSMVATTATAENMSWYLDTLMGATGIVLISVVGWLLFPRAARASFGTQSQK